MTHDATAYGRRAADVYDASASWLPTDQAVSCLLDLARGGRVLELGIGTGRLALPLHQHGVRVAGIDASVEMVEQLKQRDGGADIDVTIGDFSETRVPGTFSLVVLAYNTIFAMPDQDAQVRCFSNAAAHLVEGGRFVCEAWVADIGAYRNGSAVRVVVADENEVQLEVSRLHPAVQQMATVKVRLTDDGVRLLPANHRYAWPSELDLMARLAGLTLEHRWADWTRAPFTDESAGHVSVYRRGER